MEVAGRSLTRMVVAHTIKRLLSMEEPPIGVGSNTSARCGGRPDLIEERRHGAEPIPPKTQGHIAREGSYINAVGIQAGSRPPMKT
jgi:hypothetical protein